MKTSYEKSGVRGQTVKCATGRDDSSYKINDKQAREGREMGGGKDNISHSLSGASAVQNVEGKSGSNPGSSSGGGGDDD